MQFESRNPTSGELIARYDVWTLQQLRQQLELSHEEYLQWKKNSLKSRADHLLKLAAVLRRRQATLAKVITTEMGKPLRQSLAEVEKCAWVCDYYAERAPEFLSPQKIETDHGKSLICFQPIGAVLGIMPWNFPFWQAIRFAVPTITAGNTVILKHAPNVLGCGDAIRDCFREAGYPENVFVHAVLQHEAVADILKDERLQGVSLTGSTRAGSAVASVAGSHIKKSVLELGGSDPYIILKDADLELAAEQCAASRLINSGQSCIAAKRFIVEKPVLSAFLKLFQQAMEKRKIGSPLELETDIGPLARRDLRDNLHDQVRLSIAKGARCLLGGEPLKQGGFYYPATVLTDVCPGMPVFDDETFGPVAAVIAAEDEKSAIKLANSSP